MPGSSFVIDDSAFSETLNSRQIAIDRAWQHYDYEQMEIREAAHKEPKPSREWYKLSDDFGEK